MHSVQSILLVDCLTKPLRKSEEGLECSCLAARCSLTGQGLRSCVLFQTKGTSAADNWAAGGGRWPVGPEITRLAQRSSNL